MCNTEGVHPHRSEYINSRSYAELLQEKFGIRLDQNIAVNCFKEPGSCGKTRINSTPRLAREAGIHYCKLVNVAFCGHSIPNIPQTE